jgi:superfamily I DNA and/or RNA helicase/very-short-patch-repair endonuclease
MNSIQTKVNQVFKYLRELKKMNYSIQRKVSEFEKHWWQDELESVEDIWINDERLEEDQWVIVNRPSIPKVPDLPIVLHNWVSSWDNPELQPEPITQILRKKNSEESVYEQFTNDKKRIEAFRRWLSEEWKPWSEEAKAKQAAKKFYDEMFILYNRLQDEGDTWEMVWGQGLLTWQKDDIDIQRHLLVTPLELHFHAEKGMFSLKSTSKGTHIETDMLSHLDIPNITKAQELDVANFEPKNRQSVTILLKQIANLLSSEGKFIEDRSPVKKITPDLKITISPAIFLRKTGGRIWEDEFQNIGSKIEQNYPIPQVIKKLVTLDDSYMSESEDLYHTEWKGTDENLLFPLAANQEQKEIVQKLAKNSGVVVQGPPGTGKSHTIANLICHLLANGKRVLVTSEKERALEVLKDKIPLEVRDLCVSVLGGDSKSVKEMENSIRSIAENLERKNISILKSNIDRYQIEMDHTRRQIARIQAELNRAAKMDNEEKWIAGVLFKPVDAAKWIKEYQIHSWLPDAIIPGTRFPFTKEELKDFYRLVNAISKEDHEILHLKRPNLEKLPTNYVFKDKVNKYIEIEQQLHAGKHYLEGWNIPKQFKLPLKSSIQQTKKYVNLLQKISKEPWKATLLHEVTDSNEWSRFHEECKEQLQLLNDLEKPLLEYDIQTPDHPERKMLDDIEVVIKRIQQNKSTGWMYQTTIGKKYAYLFKGCFIDQIPAKTMEHFELIKLHLTCNQLRYKFILKWNRIMESINGPTIKVDNRRWARDISDTLDQIQVIMRWDINVVAPLVPFIQTLEILEVDWNSPVWFEHFHHGLLMLDAFYQLKELDLFFMKLSSYLQQRKEDTDAHHLWSSLYEASEKKNVKLWEETCREISRLEKIQPDYEHLQKLIRKLREVCPKWCEQFTGQQIGKPHLLPPDDLDKAWIWSQLNYWLQELKGRKSVEELEEQLQLEKRKEANLIGKLVAEQTWKAQIERTTDQQKRSLTTWMQMMKKLGKGTGKFASKYRKSASREMKQCRDAIPVWIMPIQRVVENIELTDELFDVVIVDESSQSNLFSLSALLRAKKAVIVGDDNQISPETVGLDRSQNHELMKRYLRDVPQADQFELSTSLYDTASRIFTNSKVILKEHFRCVPEIIQFSNDLMYGGKMDPLRLPLAGEIFDPPVLTVHVQEGYRKESTKARNEPEAEKLVQYLVNCCNDKKYDGKTMGVISLQGYDQAQLIENMIREELGESEMIKRKIICGDAYRFQGDERDIIFLSMVAAPNMSIGTLNKESDRRRFNVAASRARDQMILFHSVLLDDLNPQCMRYHLLNYCLYPKQTHTAIKELEHPFDSAFEKDVYRLIVARGYRVIPQVQVGSVGKRIDLVIEGTRNRLAVECDGDKWHGLVQWEADQERQRILERVGWKFWRIRGSVFYRDPEEAMEPLWKKLDEMNIYPILEQEQVRV